VEMCVGRGANLDISWCRFLFDKKIQHRQGQL